MMTANTNSFESTNKKDEIDNLIKNITSTNNTKPRDGYEMLVNEQIDETFKVYLRALQDPIFMACMGITKTEARKYLKGILGEEREAKLHALFKTIQNDKGESCSCSSLYLKN